MNNEKLFAVACFALKPDPRQDVTRLDNGGVVFKTPVSEGQGDAYFNVCPAFEAGYELVVSKELAEEAGVRRMKELYPESDGWTMYMARAEEVHAEDVLYAAANLRTLLESQEEQTKEQVM
jgi:hypothetical protein